MEKNFLIDIAKLRIAIGYLGEKSQYAWWRSSFFIPASRTYLAPVFGKTALLTRYYGMREAATLVHDERIGVGKGVFHLFRLPECFAPRLLNKEDYPADVLKKLSPSLTVPEFNQLLYLFAARANVILSVEIPWILPEDGNYRSMHVGG